MNGEEFRLASPRPQTPARAQIEGVPAEFVRHFRPDVPVLVGGLLPQEEALTMLRLRLKKHRWHPRILKTNNPLVFSIGWRRFQTMPVYSVQVCGVRVGRGGRQSPLQFSLLSPLSFQDDNERHRYLKYTPEHMHCFATMYGPVTPPNTGVVAFQV